METLHNQSLQRNEVNEILNNIPRSLYVYIISCIVFSILIFCFFLFYFNFQNSEKFDVVLQKVNPKEISARNGIQNVDTNYIGKTMVKQSLYAKIKDGAPIEIQFTLYPSQQFGGLTGIIYKSAADSILQNNLVQLQFLLPLDRKLSNGNLVSYQTGLEGTGILRENNSSFIKMIFNY